MSLPATRIAAALLTVLTLAPGSAAALFPSNATAHAAARQACNQLESSLGAPLVQTNGPDYELAATNAWNLQNTEDQPTCIVFPRTSAHVQVAMKAIYDADSHYAVQAGSHSAMKGWNTCVALLALMVYPCFQAIFLSSDTHVKSQESRMEY